jgi:GT2 family glycosyltransferase
MSEKVVKIATLTCSYNRKDKTTAFFKSMIAQSLPGNYLLDMYLLDDRSSDGTAEYIKEHFPNVKIIEGTGSLYWAGGMRKVWNYALKADDYDLFLLLNDDVTLSATAIAELLRTYESLEDRANILLGTVMDMKGERISYGGYKRTNKINNDVVQVAPDEHILKKCEIGNANIMLVDKNTVNKIGILSSRYTHSLADFDYTLTAVKKGVGVWVAPGFYGFCDNDHGNPWLPGSVPLKKRLQYLYSPTGLAYREYLAYTWKHFPLAYPSKFLKLWLKTLFPIIWDRFKKQEFKIE